MERIGVLLINVGTPDMPTPRAVKRYLAEFLTDPFVIDIPAFFRYPLVHGVILPRRASASAALYQLIWSDKGSPLLFHSLQLASAVQSRLGDRFVVRAGMRYGNPSIRAAIGEMAATKRLVIVPLYPQYSTAASESAIQEVSRALRGGLPFQVVAPFFSHRGFLESFSKRIQNDLDGFSFDKILFSFHGLPRQHVKKLHAHCYSTPNCCDRLDTRNANCYRAQCFFTANAIARNLGLKESQYEVAFQSRLTNRWIMPFSDKRYEALPKEGISNLAVVCPSFVADCLETLEEVQIRGQRNFQNFGGKRLKLVSSLNSDPHWVDTVADLVLEKISEAATLPSCDEFYQPST